jgi:hypothetical protein
MIDTHVSPRKLRTYAAVVQRSGIVHTMDMEERDWLGRRPGHSHAGTRHWRDGGHQLRSLDRKAVSHPTSIRMTGRIYSRAIHCNATCEIVDDRSTEPHIVDTEVQGATAALGSGIPGE